MNKPRLILFILVVGFLSVGLALIKDNSSNDKIYTQQVTKPTSPLSPTEQNVEEDQDEFFTSEEDVSPSYVDTEVKSLQEDTSTESKIELEESEDIKAPSEISDYKFLENLINTEEELKELDEKIESRKPAPLSTDSQVTLKNLGVVLVASTIKEEELPPEINELTGEIEYNSDVEALELEESNQLVLGDPTKEDGKETVDKSDIGTFIVTAYDLSYNCCHKERDDPEFGKTADGSFLIGMTREEAMTVAVDKDIIPLGTKLRIELQEPYKHFSGIYIARDTGSAIIKNKIDLFMGDFGKRESDQTVWDFGVRHAQVYIVE